LPFALAAGFLLLPPLLFDAALLFRRSFGLFQCLSMFFALPLQFLLRDSAGQDLNEGGSSTQVSAASGSLELDGGLAIPGCTPEGLRKGPEVCVGPVEGSFHLDAFGAGNFLYGRQ